MMLGIGREEEDRSPRALKMRRRGDLWLFSHIHHRAPVHNCFYSYQKLPKQLLIWLRVLKLDGSLLDVHVVRDATVAELKRRLEEVFMSSFSEAEGIILWSHVWGHFCLCYEGRKLLNDKKCLQTLGVKDGDQLQFVRHMSINYNPLEREKKIRRIAWKQHSG